MANDEGQGGGRLEIPLAALRIGTNLIGLKVRLIILAVGAAIVLILVTGLLALTAIASLSGSGRNAANVNSNMSGAVCGPPGQSGQTVEAPQDYQDTQVANAQLIDRVAREVGAPGAATRLAILVSIDETDLTNLDGGDRDSAGLFQQRPSQGWGTLEEVTNPEHATKSFLLGPEHDGSGGLVAVEGWESMEPYEAAWQVQRSQHRDATLEHYDEVDPILQKAGLDLDYEGSGFWASSAPASDDPFESNATSDAQPAAPAGDGCTTSGGDTAAVAGVEGLDDLPQFPIPDGCTDASVAWEPYGPDGLNGHVPDANLCALPFATDAEARVQDRPAAALIALNAEFKKEFGSDLAVYSTYRTIDKQVELKASKGYMAATPGWSNHGYGLAIDVELTPEQHTWMRENSIRFGWWHPLWARPDGTKAERWHWEYGSWLYDDRYKGKISDDQLTYNL